MNKIFQSKLSNTITAPSSSSGQETAETDTLWAQFNIYRAQAPGGCRSTGPSRAYIHSAQHSVIMADNRRRYEETTELVDPEKVMNFKDYYAEKAFKDFLVMLVITKCYV